MISRRALLVLTSVVPALRVQAAFAQPSARPARVGWITVGRSLRVDAFRDGMRVQGHVEGKTYVIEERYAAGDAARLPALVDELLRIPVDVFVAAGSVALHAVAAATKTVPVVAVSGDPVASGEVTTLARPGGNVTGLSLVSGDVAPKWLELIKTALPKLARVVVLSDRAAMRSPKIIEAIGPTLGVTVIIVDARTPPDIDIAFRRAAELNADAVIVPSSAFYSSQVPHIVDVAQRFRMPAMYENRNFTTAGGLISYGPDILATFRRAAFYVDRILKGAKPADLPIEQPTKFELIINLKTAKALGITIPPTLLARADEVIE